MSSELQFKVGGKHKTLAAYYASWARVTAIMGPLGSGKTVMSCLKVLKAMIRQEANAEGVRPSRFYAIRNTYSELFSTTIKDWMEVTGGEVLGRMVKGNLEPPTHYIQFELEDGTLVKSELVFLALDREEHVKKLRGAQATGFWLNEMKELPKAVVDMADLRHGRYPSMATGGVNPTWHGMIGDYNAPDEDHWLYELAENEKPDGWVFLKQPGGVFQRGVDFRGRPIFEPNPNAENLENLPEGYYIRGMAGKSDDWIKVNLANEYGFVQDGKPVYPTYVDSLHCREFDLLEDLLIYRGWDYGLTPACVFAQITPSGQLRFFDEIVAKRAGIDAFSDVVLKHCAQEYPRFKFVDLGDPSGEFGGGLKDSDVKSCFEIQQGKGIEIEGGDQSPEIRIESMRYGLDTLIDGEPGLLVHPRCRYLRKGFQGGYAFRRMQVSGDRYTDKPDKNQYSHPHDAAQYISGRLLGDLVRGDHKLQARPVQRVALDDFDAMTGEMPLEAADVFDAFGG